MKTQTKPYSEFVTQAEEATRAIKDPELRRVAFERVLDDLLSGGGSATPSGVRAAKQVEGSERMAAKAKKHSGPTGYVRNLIDEGFFKKPKTIAEVKAELAKSLSLSVRLPRRLRRGRRTLCFSATIFICPLKNLCTRRPS